MILAYDNIDFEAIKAFLPMSYLVNPPDIRRTSNSFEQGGLIWPKKIQTSRNPDKTGFQNSPYLSSPALIQSVQTLIDSTPAICLSRSEWAKVKPSADYTARPAEPVSASVKALLWRTQSFLRRWSFASLNALATAAQLKLPPTSAKLTSERLSDTYRKAANEQMTSIDCNWNGLSKSKVSSKLSSWMNYTAGLPKSQKRGQRIYWGASWNGSDVGSYRPGGSKPLCSGFAGWASHSGNRLRIARYRGYLLLEKAAFAVDRRAFALSGGYFAGFWANQASAKKEWSWSQKKARSQATAFSFGRRSQEDSECQRQAAGCLYLCPVWAPEGYKTSDSAIGYRQDYKYFPFGTSQWDLARSADSSCQADSQWLSDELLFAMGIVAVERYVQLDACTWLPQESYASDGFGVGREGLVGFGIHSLPGSCQRPPATVLVRTAQGRSRIRLGEVST